MISSRDLKHNLTEEKIKHDEQTKSNAASREPSPNRGGSIPDFQAIGPDSESKEEWLKKQGIDVTKQVKFSKLSHMRYQHPDLQQITTFLRDFGMHVIKKTETQRWYAGYGPDQYVYYAQQGPKKFLGGAFEVQSYAELERALHVPGAKVLSNGIEKMDDAPGGGYIVVLEDPEGFPLNLIFGQESLSEERRKRSKTKEKVVWNDEIDKPRQRAFNRFEAGPAEVYKLGHFGLNVANFPAAMKWYTTHFNLIPSDILYIPTPPSSAVDSTTSSLSSSPSDKSSSSSSSSTAQSQRTPVALFAHINLQKTLTDHHTMFLTSLSPPSKNSSSFPPSTTQVPHPKSDPSIPHVHHSSFEVHDLDTQFLGHQWLASKSYSSVWGVGRHILGSQIFDYWWDTTGFMVEHYADGDLVNDETRIGYGPAGHEGLAVWGPEVPREFLD